jgi:hypothetical protein
MFTSKKNLITFAALSVTALVLVAIIATNLLRGHRKQVEDRRIAVLVADGTAQLREALARAPTSAAVAKLDEYVQSVRSSPDPAMGSIAEAYLLGAREIARQRVQSARLAGEAAAARSALAAHMARAERRNTNWIRGATELKRRVEASHADLDRSLKALDGLLGGLPDTEQRLAPHLTGTALLDAAEIDAARKRVQQDSQRATAELEQVRRIGF